MLRNIVDIYRLSPMQHGMLFHSLYDAADHTYFKQQASRIEGKLDVEAFRGAWEEIIKRHTILRTGILWEGLQEPVQFVRKSVTLPWREDDWRGASDLEVQEKLNQFLREDRDMPFDLKRPPLLRIVLIRTGEDVYYFIWAAHHIILDGWCNHILIQEVFALYEAYRQGREHRLPAPVPYGEYISWLQKQDEKKAEEFWRAELRGLTFPTQLRMQADSSTPASEQDGSDERTVYVSQSVTERIDQLAKSLRVTINTFVQAAWALLLSRYTGEQDVLFGATLAGRSAPLPGIQSMVGLFINTLPVRVRLADEESVGAYIMRIQARQAEAREYEYVPLKKVQAWSDVASGTALFDHIMVFENYPMDASATVDGELRIRTIENFDINNLPLTFIVTPGKELVLRCVYKWRDFTAQAVEQLLEHLRVLMAVMVKNPAASVSDLSFLSEADRNRVLGDWNRTDAVFPRTCIHELFDAQVSRTPDAIAVRMEGQQLTYRALAEKAYNLSRRLKKLGVGPEICVGICTDRSIAMVIGLLGTLKSGGAYVPLDPFYPAERLEFMIRDAKMPVLLTQKHLQEVLPATPAKIVCIDENAEATEWPESDMGVALADENAAYVIYTSGSTGKPKAVMITHGCIRNHMLWMQREFPVINGDAVLQKTPFIFDASVWEFYSPLLSGATLVIARLGGHQDAEYLLNAVREQEITILQLVPTQLRMLLQQPDLEQCCSLKRIYCGGEALEQELVRELNKRLPSAKLYNLYGPTEATIDATLGICDANESGLTAPIGKPVANTQVFVLDDRNNPVPLGVKGELYIGGAGVARGYLGRPDLTAERFVPDRFSAKPGQRLYKTGDKVMWRPDDAGLVYIGRLDHQVKVRGYRLELGEIEAVLNSLGEIRQSAVMLREDDPKELRLVAYIVGKEEDRQLNINVLRKELKEKLPEYMVPAAFVQMPELPLMPNGKLNRKALPRPEANQQKTKFVFHDQEEEILAEIFADVLKLDAVKTEDNFFEIGGHSLHATQVISRVRNAFAVDLPLPALFEYPTPAGLLQELKQIQGVTRGASSRITSAPRDQALPLSYAQQRLWFLHQLEPETPAYNVTLGLQLTGNLDTKALAHSIGEVTRRHEILRTSFPIRNGKPIQDISPHSVVNLEQIDLRRPPDEERVQAVQRFLQAEAAAPFILENGPLLRLKLIQMELSKHLFVLTMHHMISDGWSIHVMAREIVECYYAYQRGEPANLPELTIQYVDFAVWQHEWLQGEVLAEQVKYWRRQLEGATSLELPTDHPRPRVAPQQCGLLLCSIPSDLTARLKALGRREGATLFMVLMAGFQVLLSWYTKKCDIAIGTAVANRNRGETEELIGFFVNQLVIRTNLEGNPPFTEVVERVERACLDAYAHQDIPFDKVIEAVAPERITGRLPFIEVSFLLHNFPAIQAQPDRSKPHALSIEAMPHAVPRARFDFLLELAEKEGGLSGAIEYRSELFERSTIEMLVARFEDVLRLIADRPALRLNDLTEHLDKSGELALQQASVGRLRGIRNKAIDQPRPDAAWNVPT